MKFCQVSTCTLVTSYMFIIFIAAALQFASVNSQDQNRKSTDIRLKDSTGNRWNSPEKTSEDSSEKGGNNDEDDDDDDDDDDKDDDDDDDPDEDDHHRVTQHGGASDSEHKESPSTAKNDESDSSEDLPRGNVRVHDGDADLQAKGSEILSSGSLEPMDQSVKDPGFLEQSEVADQSLKSPNDEKTMFIAVGVAFSAVIVLAAAVLLVITLWRRRRQKGRNGAHLAAASRESIEFETIPTTGTLDEESAATARVTSRDLPPNYEEATKTTA